MKQGVRRRVRDQQGERDGISVIIEDVSDTKTLREYQIEMRQRGFPLFVTRLPGDV